jgi:hypothetical protein
MITQIAGDLGCRRRPIAVAMTKMFGCRCFVVAIVCVFGGNGSSAGTQVGTGFATYYIYAGQFDNVYYQSSNQTGNLWVLGNTGAVGGTLYQIPITANVMSTSSTQAVPGLTPGSGSTHAWPSPITEFCNSGANPCTASATQTTSGTDYLFFSVYRGSRTAFAWEEVTAAVQQGGLIA